MDSILTTIKKLLGIDEQYTHFDEDIIIYINSALLSLTQIGVGPEEGFMITDDSSEWSEFVSGTLYESVKTYIYLKVKLLFDPPASSSVSDSMKSIIEELEWRLSRVTEDTPSS